MASFHKKMTIFYKKSFSLGFVWEHIPAISTVNVSSGKRFLLKEEYQINDSNL